MLDTERVRLDGPSRLLAGLVVVVVVLAVVAGLVVVNRSAPPLDPESPEGVVQQFLQAVVDEDHTAAVALVASSAGCEVSDIASARPDSESLNVVLAGVRIEGDRAVVKLDVTEGSGGDLFGSSGYTYSERIVLKRRDGAWRIASSPWLLFLCEDRLEGSP